MREEESSPTTLPKGWTRSIIGNVICRDGLFVDGDWIESKDQDPKGDIRLIQLADIGDGDFRNRSNRYLTLQKAKELNCTFLSEGDVLVARMPDPLGRACLFPLKGDQNYVTAVDVAIIRTGSGGIDNKFLMYIINTLQIRSEIEQLQTGTTRKRISRSNLAKISIPIAPLPEQRRIVTTIEELLTKLDAGVEALKKVKSELKRYRQSVLKSAFEGKLTAEWQKANKGKNEPASFLLERIIENQKKAQGKKFKELPPLDVSELQKLPTGWVWTRIGDVSEIVRGASPRPAGDPKYFGGDIPWITVGEITKDSNIHLTLVSSYVTKAGKEKSRYIDSGTFLLTNSGATLGVPKITLISGCINDGSVAMLGMDETLKRYLYYFLTGKTASLRRINQGAAQPNLNTTIVSQIVFPLPPSDEQSVIVKEIERHLSVADAVEKVVEQNLKHSERLRQSILKKAFEGKLLPQDPTDEPAEKLLERIKAEKEILSSEGTAARKSKKQKNSSQGRLI